MRRLCDLVRQGKQGWRQESRYERVTAAPHLKHDLTLMRMPVYSLEVIPASSSSAPGTTISSHYQRRLSKRKTCHSVQRHSLR
ncbi:hypothetical protein BDP81DRAFT_136256 [Colletotrichum phormii]|uniref:Uncharacterized protein n=1 Tax=Colletotrichum phormii TaxID=359342 RepID=A0AAI9ZER1_9PEZI|nr:uncharacterized protein BDP81DRAFT_136256 [Colletotrichum phormii]KAK1623202.1 hypothetical protein BDP81DRAFT_136256 [Colletotrichum phormii]